jgi:glutamine synthetase
MRKHAPKQASTNYSALHDTAMSSDSLSLLLECLKSEHDIIPVLGAELEWFVVSPEGEAATDPQREHYLTALRDTYAEIAYHSIEKERGVGQVELALLPMDAHTLIAQLAQLKVIASNIAAQQQLIACFDAKPFAKDYGSGLHIHIHLENTKGESLYYVQQRENETHLSDWLSMSIGGLLTSLPDHLWELAGSKEAMQRYQPWWDAPIAANWGYNNRTTALRLPDNVGHSRGAEKILSTRDQATDKRRYKRIEHRVPSSEANPEHVITAILSGVYYGISTRTPAPPPTYGNSYMEVGESSSFNCHIN